MDKLSLTLFVTGQTVRSQSAIANLRRICQEMSSDQYELAVVDVLENPQLAEEAKIIATPTLVKSSPAPIRRIVGDLSDGEQVLAWLNLPNLIKNEN